jgi:hypothetical protein
MKLNINVIFATIRAKCFHIDLKDFLTALLVCILAMPVKIIKIIVKRFLVIVNATIYERIA